MHELEKFLRLLKALPEESLNELRADPHTYLLLEDEGVTSSMIWNLFNYYSHLLVSDLLEESMIEVLSSVYDNGKWNLRLGRRSMLSIAEARRNQLICESILAIS